MQKWGYSPFVRHSKLKLSVDNICADAAESRSAYKSPIGLHFDHSAIILHPPYSSARHRTDFTSNIRQHPKPRMKFNTLTLFLALFIISTAIASAAAKKKSPKPSTISCRLHKGISRCVDVPVKRRFLPIKLRRVTKGRFCPYHICGPSYIPTDECPPNGQAPATGKCAVRKTNMGVWLCRERFGKPVKHLVGFPFGCGGRRGPKCRSKVHICSCFRRRVKQQKLKHLLDYTPECPV